MALAAAISRRRFLRVLGFTLASTTLPGRVLAAAAAPAPARLRFGVQTSPQHTSYEEIVRVWERAEALGLDSAFVFDHFIPIFADPLGPCFEGWTLLSALAAKTHRIKVGVLVTGNTYRHPAVLAKMAATVDHVSNGRLILGLGAGWFEREHTAYGIPFYTPGERARRLAEAVVVLKRLFTAERSSFTGRRYALKDAPFAPKTVQRPYPPILIGGMGPKVVQPLAARHADIWHFFIRSGAPAEAKRLITQFDALCREAKRDPAAVEKATSVRADELADVDVATMRARVGALLDAGVQHVILGLPAPYDHDLLARFATEVVPALREARK